MREICTSGSTREREATVFGPVPFTPCFPLYSTVKAFVNEPDKQSPFLPLGRSHSAISLTFGHWSSSLALQIAICKFIDDCKLQET